ncbi:MAG: ABC transporter permease [Chloroflexi bacterium]|nr:ABC transporter permease [Chloroflexota bacterium]
MTQANQAINPRVTSPAEARIQQQSAADLASVLSKKPRTLWGDAWRRFRHHRVAMIGATVLLIFIIASIFGPILYKVNPEALDAVNLLSKPLTPGHLLGTDEIGHDLLARAFFGGRISIAVGFVAMLIAVSLGSLVGALAGFFGGKLDQLLMRTTDLFLSLPQLPLLLLTVYLFRDPVTKALGPEKGIFIIVVVMIGALAWMSTARIVRASFLSLKRKEFVEAAVGLGVNERSIMFRHILPNALSPIIVAATLEVGNAIITESTLSFLGVGFPPDTPTWGRLVTDGSQFLQAAPWLAIVPGVLIFLTVLSINFMGDGLRDALDPRQRQ